MNIARTLTPKNIYYYEINDSYTIFIHNMLKRMLKNKYHMLSLSVSMLIWINKKRYIYKKIEHYRLFYIIKILKSFMMNLKKHTTFKMKYEQVYCVNYQFVNFKDLNMNLCAIRIKLKHSSFEVRFKILDTNSVRCTLSVDD